MPPPCCMVSAACLRCSKMPLMSSGMAPMTKQLNRVTLRPVPAPARMRPAGRNLKSSIASKNRPAHSSGSFSGAASAAATRRQVSEMVLSNTSPSAPLWRYFMSQICCEMAATGCIRSLSGRSSAGSASGEGKLQPTQGRRAGQGFVPVMFRDGGEAICRPDATFAAPIPRIFADYRRLSRIIPLTIVPTPPARRWRSRWRPRAGP